MLYFFIEAYNTHSKNINIYIYVNMCVLLQPFARVNLYLKILSREPEERGLRIVRALKGEKFIIVMILKDN